MRIPDRELALVKSKTTSMIFGSALLKYMNDELEKLNATYRKGIRKFKALEIQAWPPKMRWEWEFPFKD